MNLTKIDQRKWRPGRNVRGPSHRACLLVGLSLSVLLGAFPSLAQSQQPADQQSSGRIIGTILDQTGVPIAGARVTLARDDNSPNQDVLSGDDGQFSFAAVAPGTYHLTIASPGLATQSISGILHSGEDSIVPQVTLKIAENVTEVRVEPSQTEVAEVQLKEEEKQRVLGVFPNFYVSYIPDAAPLTSKQKFKLALRDTVDPVTFGVTAAVAGLEQAADQYGGYGQGAEGYAKRYGAAYADLVTSNFIGSAILPSLLKQDPRYFYRGTGTTRTRVLYAIANAVICKGDNKRWQPNYSSIAGSFAAGGISNLYYPAAERGAENTVENALIAIGESAAANVFQEFVVKKFTPSVSKRHPES